MPSERKARRSKARETSPVVARGPSVADVYAALDKLAPFAGAADWDNVGLLAGRSEWPAHRVLVALDLTDAVAREALRKRVDALVVYHPPIFEGIRAITPQADGPTGLLADLLAARIAILSTHTAFDTAVGGTNDLLLDLFAPVSRRPLAPAMEENGAYKLVVFVPPPEVNKLRRALSVAGGGVIGHYTECSFELAGHGSFRGDETTRPAVGRKQVLEYVDEVRLEMVVPRQRLGDVVRMLYATHSYEEPAFDLYPLHQLTGRGAAGLGRVGQLKKSQRGTALVRTLGKAVDLSLATCVGDLRRSFRSLTAAGGAFGVRQFVDPDSLVLTGEVKHHDALQLLRRGVTAICLGHHASERLALDALCRRLGGSLDSVNVTLARSDRAPFQRLRV
ncbi:MAG: YqfO family protein [Phycisphaerae bacterium]